MTDLRDMIRPHLLRPQGYAGGTHSSRLTAQTDVPTDRIIKLNANENPYPPLPEIGASLAQLPIHEYPDQHLTRIRDALSRYTGRPPEQIIAGSGSDEIIELLIRLFIAPGEAMIDCPPTFGMYEFCARIAEAELIQVPRHDDWQIDIPATVDAIERHNAKIVFIASPNNPTGNLMPSDHARAILDTGCVLAVDETYHEFCGETLAHLLDQYENLVILRSFSKWAGIAGLRIGYAIASQTIIDHMMTIKQPFNVNIAAEAAALAALEHRDRLLQRIQTIIQQRSRLQDAIETLPQISYSPSDANFLLVEFHQTPAQEANNRLAQRGIFVRQFSTPRLEESLRISIGTPDQNQEVIKALNQIT